LVTRDVQLLSVLRQAVSALSLDLRQARSLPHALALIQETEEPIDLIVADVTAAAAHHVIAEIAATDAGHQDSWPRRDEPCRVAA